MAALPSDYEYRVISGTNVRVYVKASLRDKTSYSDIPATFQDGNVTYTVTSVRECFENCSSLTQAPTIPSGVTDMGECFYRCSSLSHTPTIPDSVTYMTWCFYGCSSLTQAPTIPSGVSSIAECFNGCTSLRQAPSIPSGVTDMSSCFEHCSSLTQVPTVPSGVKDISRCFYDCMNIPISQLVNLLSGLTRVEDIGGFFYGRTDLTSAPTIPSSVTSMMACFYDCTSLTQAPSIPSGVTKLANCFYGCTSLTQAPTIPSGVTSMASCFRGCTSLTQAPSIPSSVTRLDGCFYECSSLVTPPSLSYGVEDLRSCFYGCSSLRTAPTIPASVTDMSYTNNSKRGCFAGCTSLTQAPTIPSSVTRLNSCFYGCTSLVGPPNFDLPSSVTNMSQCFYGCGSLTTAPVIPPSVENVDSCFCLCTSLEGSIEVAFNPTSYLNLFTSTAKDIYICPSGYIDEELWRSIAAGYSKVHFFTDDNSSPTVSISVARVASSGSTTESEDGLWAYVVVQASVYADYLPPGKTNSLKSITVAHGGIAISSWNSESQSTVGSVTTYTKTKWLQVSAGMQVFSAVIRDQYKTSPITKATLAGTGVLLDILDGGLGIGIGRYARGSGIDVGFDATFNHAAYMSGHISVAGSTAIPTVIRAGWNPSSPTSVPRPCLVVDPTASPPLLYWCPS